MKYGSEYEILHFGCLFKEREIKFDKSQKI